MSSPKAFVCVVGCFVLVAGCGGGADSSCSPSQGLSMACCKSLGIDACGAGLFCAALDGRSQATCYPEHSRLDAESCDEDRDCQSSLCNPDAKQCAYSPGSSCQPALGCGPLNGAAEVCVADTRQNGEPLTCLPKGAGQCGDYCASSSDCVAVDGFSGSCNTDAHQCRCGLEGGDCLTAGCVDGSCQDPGGFGEYACEP